MSRTMIRKPKVCFVLNIAPIYRQALLKELDNNNSVDYFFATGDKDMQISALTSMRQYGGFVGHLQNCFKGTKLVWQKGWFKLLFEGYDYFILTGNGGIRSNWLLMIVARLMGKKIFLWTHGLYGYERGLDRVKKLLQFNLASGLFTYGSYGKKMIVNSGYNADKITVVYNSLDVELQKSLRERKESNLFLRNYFGNNLPTVIFLGRLTPQKSLSLLLDALAILKAQGTVYNCLVVGEGSEELKLRERCSELGIEEQVWFYGSLYDEDMIATLFKLSDICVSPGNVGLTAMHAMSYGVPVITHNNYKRQMPEFEVVRSGITGEFFKENDSLDLAEKIEQSINRLSTEKGRKDCDKWCKTIIDKIYNPTGQAALFTNRILKEWQDERVTKIE